MQPIKIPSYARDGKLTFKNERAGKQKIAELKDGSYMVTIERFTKRSLLQNAWIHAVLPDILAALRDAGYDEVKTVHDAKLIVKALFFKREYTNGLETIPVIEGTSETDKTIFAERAEEIIKWGAEYLGINIAPPAKQLEFTESFYQ